MNVKLERDLKVVIPLESGAICYSIPVSRQIFETNYMAFAKIWSAIQEQGLVATGASIAARMLRQLAVEQNLNVDPILGEIRRLCTIAIPTEHGYQQYPMDNAVRDRLIDEDDIAEIENLLVFSIAVSYLSTKAQAAKLLEWVRGMRKALTTSLTFTDFLASLQTSMQDDSSGEKSPT